jgi:hypothetical protein
MALVMYCFDRGLVVLLARAIDIVYMCEYVLYSHWFPKVTLLPLEKGNRRPRHFARQPR